MTDIFAACEKMKKDFKKLDKHGIINCGGCGVVAYGIAKAVDKSLKPKLVVVGGGWGFSKDEPINKLFAKVKPSNLREFNQKTDTYLNHILCEVTVNDKKYYIDSTGIKTKREIEEHSWNKMAAGHLPLNHAKKLIDSPEGWNSTFDRSMIPKINKIIKRHLV